MGGYAALAAQAAGAAGAAEGGEEWVGAGVGALSCKGVGDCSRKRVGTFPGKGRVGREVYLEM